MYDAKRFGANVLLSRRDLDMTQEALAEKVGVSRAYVTNIEYGRGKNVGIEGIFGLAAALGVTVPYLLGLTDDPLGEGTEKVLREQSADYLVFEVESGEQRRLGEEVIDEFNALTARGQRVALQYLRMMRQVENEERATVDPRIVGEE